MGESVQLLYIKLTKSMKTCLQLHWIFAVLVVAILAFAPQNSRAQTYTWADNAQGQIYLTCPNGMGGYNYSYYPIDTNWSQSVEMGPNCDGDPGMVQSQPSNWDPALGVGVYPGGPGAVGVNAILGAPANTVLDVPVTLNNLTILPTGVLSIGACGGLSANTIDLEGNGQISYAPICGGGLPYLNILPGGNLTRTNGSGSFAIETDSGTVNLYEDNANINVDSGTLVLPYLGVDTHLYNTMLVVSNNCSLLFGPNSNSITQLAGNISGGGGGTVSFSMGTITGADRDFNGNDYTGLILNFPTNMFQWSGGAFSGDAYDDVTNDGFINITNIGPQIQGIYFYNDGTMNLDANSSLDLEGFHTFENDAGGTFNILGDSSIIGVANLANYGLIRKSAGTGMSQILPSFENYGGTLEVDTGTLSLNLNYNGCYITNGNFVVSNGATLDFMPSNYSAEVEGVLTGSGGGAVLMNNGTLTSEYNGILNFPGNMFQWSGGSLDGVTNDGVLNLVGPGIIGDLYNNGQVIQSADGSMSYLGFSSTFYNETGGVYQLENDNGYGTFTFYNYGTVEKTAGFGTSILNGYFYNYGNISVASGSLEFTNGEFAQDAGVLQLTPAMAFGEVYLNGGTITGAGTLGSGANSVELEGGVLAPGNPYGAITIAGQSGLNCHNNGSINFAIGGANQFNQLIIQSAADLGGTVNVILTNGYTPPVGAQFQIIAGTNNIYGAFQTNNLPPGIALTYTNTGVYLTMVGLTPVQIQSPTLSGGNFTFQFATTNGLDYTIQTNSNLNTTNWGLFNSIIGDGSTYQFVTPVTNMPYLFFRIRQP